MNISNLEFTSKKAYHHRIYTRYHIIFVTKYRRKCLEKIKQDVFDAFKYCESKSHFTIIKMNTDNDHIHLLISIPAEYSIGQTVSRLKQMTTNYLYNIDDTYLHTFYWKKKRLLWTHGYFVSTVGMISDKNVITYIENQGK